MGFRWRWLQMKYHRKKVSLRLHFAEPQQKVRPGGRPIPTGLQRVKIEVVPSRMQFFHLDRTTGWRDEQLALKVRVVWRKTVTLSDKLQFSRSPQRMHQFSPNSERLCPPPGYSYVSNLVPFRSPRRVQCSTSLMICSFSNCTFQHTFGRRIAAKWVRADFIADSVSSNTGLSGKYNFVKIEL